jgi:hypothetical protein
MRRTALVVAALAITAARPATAGGDDAAVRALYAKATSAMDRGDFATACPQIEEVLRRKPSSAGARIELAKCYEGLGRLASAAAAYASAAEIAARARDAENQRIAVAGGRALQNRVATIVVRVPGDLRDTAGLAVTRDGVKLGAAEWGVAVPIDKGRHTVVVEAPGRARWERAIVVADGEAAAVAAGLGDPVGPPTPVDPASPAHAPPVAGRTGELSSPPAVAPAPSPPSRSWVIPGLAIGVGAVGFGAAGVATGLLLSKKSTIASECDPATKQCSSAGLAAVDAVGPLNAVGTAGIVVGALGAAGLVTWLVWPTEKAGATRVAPAVAPGYAGVTVQRGF